VNRLRKRYLGLLAALLAVLPAACRHATEHSAEMLVFGTIMQVKLWGVDEGLAGRAFADLQQMFQRMHRDWHAWEPGLLTDINEAFAQGRPAAADADVVAMVRRSQVFEQRSEGRFNPAIGELIRLWGFHTSDYPIIGPPPPQEAIDALLAYRPSSLDIRVDGTRLSSVNPHVQLDFGGIAKGFAVDLAIAHLRELGVANAIVNAGGDLRAMGDHGDRPWRVAVRQPGGGVLGAVEVVGDEALFTSGNYERFREYETERYPHILDPRTGWPVADVASVTVIAPEGIEADAAATALIVAGLDDWPAVARRFGLDQVLVVDEAGKVYMTPAMAGRVRFATFVETVIVEPGA
jgi:thiamine biosynthesis lipoprotein